MLRFGLVCLFRQEPIKFRRTTAKHLHKFPRKHQLEMLSQLCLHNANALEKALIFCAGNKIGSFRVNSKILPLKTHPEVGYKVKELPESKEIIRKFEHCGKLAQQKDIRTLFHPDQFIVLSSPNKKVVNNSIKEIEYQTEVAEWIKADVINVHAGGKYDSKKKALARFAQSYKELSKAARKKLTIENDDYIYSPAELLPFCKEVGLPLVYDAHHHRCLPDELSLAEATTQALATWQGEPLFHISSPKYGWKASNCRSHHDYIQISDFPEAWKDLDITVEVEAKAKELAVLKLIKELNLF